MSAAKSNFLAGCSAIAAAITAMGVATASNATPETMSTNIKRISDIGNISLITDIDSTAVTIQAGFKYALIFAIRKSAVNYLLDSSVNGGTKIFDESLWSEQYMSGQGTGYGGRAKLILIKLDGASATVTFSQESTIKVYAVR